MAPSTSDQPVMAPSNESFADYIVAFNTSNQDVFATTLPSHDPHHHHLRTSLSTFCPIDTSNRTNTTAVEPSPVFPVSSAIIFTIGTTLALYFLIRRPSRDSKATAFYRMVKVLILADFLGQVLTTPIVIYAYISLQFNVKQIGGQPLCDYLGFAMSLAGNFTLFIVFMMSVERFLVTKYPFQYSRIVTSKSVVYCLLTMAAMTVLTALLPVVGLGSYTTHFPHTWCFMDFRGDDLGNRAYSISFAVFGLFVLLVTIVLNLIVIQHLWSMRQSSRRITSSVRSRSHISNGSGGGGGGGGGRGSGGSDSEIRMIIFLIVIIVVFTVCWAPILIRVLINQIVNAGIVSECPDKDTRLVYHNQMDLLAIRIAAYNQQLDPWVYIISRMWCAPRRRNSRDLSTMPHPSIAHQQRNGTSRPGSSSSPVTSQRGRVARVWDRFRWTMGIKSIIENRQQNNNNINNNQSNVPLTNMAATQQNSTPTRAASTTANHNSPLLLTSNIPCDDNNINYDDKFDLQKSEDVIVQTLVPEVVPNHGQDESIRLVVQDENV